MLSCSIIAMDHEWNKLYVATIIHSSASCWLSIPIHPNISHGDCDGILMLCRKMIDPLSAKADNMIVYRHCVSVMLISGRIVGRTQTRCRCHSRSARRNHRKSHTVAHKSTINNWMECAKNIAPQQQKSTAHFVRA